MSRSGSAMGGVGAGLGKFTELRQRLHAHRSRHGAIPGPFETWLALRGIRTLSLRVERAGASAAEIARRLLEQPGVRAVRYPGLTEDPGHERAAQQLQGGLLDVALGPVQLLEHQDAGALAGLVSGSGPTVAFLATDEDGARDLANDLSEYGMQAFPVHGPVPGARVTTP